MKGKRFCYSEIPAAAEEAAGSQFSSDAPLHAEGILNFVLSTPE